MTCGSHILTRVFVWGWRRNACRFIQFNTFQEGCWWGWLPYTLLHLWERHKALTLYQTQHHDSALIVAGDFNSATLKCPLLHPCYSLRTAIRHNHVCHLENWTMPLSFSHLHTNKGWIRKLQFKERFRAGGHSAGCSGLRRLGHVQVQLWWHIYRSSCGICRESRRQHNPQNYHQKVYQSETIGG